MSSPSPEPAAADARPEGRVGQVISGRYRIVELLGEGGMGAVYLAEHTHMRKRVALKLLHPEMSDNAEVLARFEREAMAAAHIEHPNVASATDFGRTDDGGFFLVLEYVEGTGLRQVLGRGALPARQALHIARQIALALERAHGAGIVHRDLKPENVMLVRRADDPDFVKVLDFGIAKVSDPALSARGQGGNQPLTRMGSVLGTPEYMAPEQALGEAVTPPSDLYAVGIMLYEMLTGLHPFDPPDRIAMLSFHIVAPVPPMRERAPNVDVAPAVEAVVTKLLEKDAKARYASARALIDAIDQAAAASGIDLRSPTPAPPENVARIAPAGHSPAAPNVGNAAPDWKDNDSFAQTSLGLPAATAPNSATPSTTGASTTSASTALGPKLVELVETLKKQPLGVQVALGAAPIALLLVALAIAVAVRPPPIPVDGRSIPSASGGSDAKAKVKLAPEDKVRAAAAQGVPALEALAKEYPDDPAVPRQIAIAYASAGRAGDALAKVRDICHVDAAACGDADLVRIVAQAAEGQNEDAFALLESSMGERGVDVLLELSARARSPVTVRATRSLGKAEVRSHASPAALLLLDWKDAKQCAGKRDLLDRAKAVGDARLLGSLKKLKETRGCGFLGARDCWPCLRKDDALDDAIAAIELRAGAK